jgi:hypothetical protein
VAATVPTVEPSEFRAGDSVLWTRTLADYPADEWSLSYFLVGPAQKITIAATADGTDFAVELTPAVTSPLQAGDYFLTGRVTDGTQVFTVVEQKRVKVLPNFAGDDVTAGFDGRSFNRRVRDALRQMVEGSAAFPEIAYTIFGERSVNLVPIKDRLDALGRFEALVRDEERAEAANSGQRTGVYFRFRNPR